MAKSPKFLRIPPFTGATIGHLPRHLRPPRRGPIARDGHVHSVHQRDAQSPPGTHSMQQGTAIPDRRTPARQRDSHPARRPQLRMPAIFA
eukprot:2489312-Prymnesium_polylepis.1